ARARFVVPPDPVVSHVGSTVILPCWLSPPENAEALEIRWYRHDQFSNPVLLYNHGKIQDVQEESYRNRSSLTLRSDQSGGLKDGDVSLRLEKLTIQDEDSFRCYVSGEHSYSSEEVDLKITALGSAPVLFPKPLDDGRVNISCRTSGWYPEPNITWTSDEGRALGPGGTSHSRGADEMFSVHSWTAVSLSDAQLVSCSVSLRTGEFKEGRLNIQGIVSSGLITVAHVFFLTVEITIDREHLHKDLKVSKDCKILRDSKDYHHTGEEFPFQLCAFGAQSFSSGRHYWEVELVRSPNPPKKFWIIGVVKDRNFTTRDGSALTPSRGFWFLCSDGPRGFYTNTDPSIRFSLTPRPERLGVLLDYDDGQLSFYNVTERKHLLTISSRFSGSVVPLFNPGAGDPCPLKILDCPKPEESAESSDNLKPVESAESSHLTDPKQG
uniref:Butyrophilin subfamily 1 member A1 n=1 Tax=Cyprinus carpio TaxID=7962 RepID=A0A8C2CIG6_CYPCA